MNLDGLKSSFTYTPTVGESLDRIIAKTMPNCDLKSELLAEAFKALNPMLLSKEPDIVAKSNIALKVPNQNQLLSMFEKQFGEKQILVDLPQSVTMGVEKKIQTKGVLAGTSTATNKINPKTVNWVRFPVRMMSMSKTMETWVRFPKTVGVNVIDSDWVQYPRKSNEELESGITSKLANEQRIKQREWVRYQIAKSEDLAD